MVLSLRLLFPWLQLEVFDAHRLGLKPIRRRVWALCGKTPLAQERPHRRGLLCACLRETGNRESGYGLLPSGLQPSAGSAGGHTSRGCGPCFLPPTRLSYSQELIDGAGAKGSLLRLLANPACAHTALYPVSLVAGGCQGNNPNWTYAASTCTGNRGLKSRLSLPAMSLRRHW